MRLFVPLLAWAILLEVASNGFAHFNMLLPDKPSAKKGEDVVITYQWGHPFELQLFYEQETYLIIFLFADGNAL
jgi:hypothetical protein